jgi:hypothetical protein
MKKLLLIFLILASAGGLFWAERRELARIAEESERARAELERVAVAAGEVKAESSRLAADLAAREETLTRLRDQAAAVSAAARAVTISNAFGPADGIPSWSEREPFVWMEKQHLGALGVAAFRAYGTDVDVGEDVAALLQHISREFLKKHPELAGGLKLTPEQVAEVQAEYAKLLAEALAGLDEQTRAALEAAMRQGDAAAPVEYRLNEDAAVLLGMTRAERDEVEQATRDLIERHRELERSHLSVSDDHIEDVMSPGLRMATFKVEAFPLEGGALKAEWIRRLHDALGADRTRYLVQMSERWIRSDLGDFGEGERVITMRDGLSSSGFTEKSSTGHYASQGTGGPAPIPPAWRHLIARPPEGGLPRVRQAE